MPAHPPASHELAWVKSSYSGGNTTECVECAHADGQVLLRDTKLGGALVASVEVSAWHVFTDAVRRGWASGF
jgi:hypothetical protein